MVTDELGKSASDTTSDDWASLAKHSNPFILRSFHLLKKRDYYRTSETTARQLVVSTYISDNTFSYFQAVF